MAELIRTAAAEGNKQQGNAITARPPKGDRNTKSLMSSDAQAGSKRPRESDADEAEVASRARTDSAPAAAASSPATAAATESNTEGTGASSSRVLDLSGVKGSRQGTPEAEGKHKILDLRRVSSHAPASAEKTAEAAASSSTTSSSSAGSTTRTGLLDFLIIGVQKAGTMAAVKNLNKHPEIFVCREPHFFDLYWDMGLDWYKSKLRSNKKFIGEKTPELIYVDACAPRMKQVCPDARFILMLRDPVKRAYSSWNMQTGRNMEELPFGECVDRELNTMMGEKRVFGTAEYHYIQKGFYMDQIERFLKVFPDR